MASPTTPPPNRLGSYRQLPRGAAYCEALDLIRRTTGPRSFAQVPVFQPSAALSRNHKTRPSGRIVPAGYWLGFDAGSSLSAATISHLSAPQTKKNVFRAWLSTT